MSHHLIHERHLCVSYIVQLYAKNVISNDILSVQLNYIRNTQNKEFAVILQTLSNLKDHYVLGFQTSNCEFTFSENKIQIF